MPQERPRHQRRNDAVAPGALPPAEETSLRKLGGRPVKYRQIYLADGTNDSGTFWEH